MEPLRSKGLPPWRSMRSNRARPLMRTLIPYAADSKIMIVAATKVYFNSVVIRLVETHRGTALGQPRERQLARLFARRSIRGVNQLHAKHGFLCIPTGEITSRDGAAEFLEQRIEPARMAGIAPLGRNHLLLERGTGESVTIAA